MMREGWTVVSEGWGGDIGDGGTQVIEGWGGTRAAIVAATLLLSGCATAPEPRIEIKEVLIPTPVGCVPPTLSNAPRYPDTDEALRAATPAQRYALMAAGRLLRAARIAELEPVIEGCPRK